MSTSLAAAPVTVPAPPRTVTGVTLPDPPPTGLADLTDRWSVHTRWSGGLWHWAVATRGDDRRIVAHGTEPSEALARRAAVATRTAMLPPPGPVTGPQAATLLGVDPKTIRTWEDRGQITRLAWASVHRPMFDVAELLACEAARRAAGTARHDARPTWERPDPAPAPAPALPALPAPARTAPALVRPARTLPSRPGPALPPPPQVRTLPTRPRPYRPS